MGTKPISIKISIALAAVLLLAGCASLPMGNEDAWARRTLRGLTLRQRIAQMMIAGMNMRFINSDSRQWRRLEQLLSTDGIGGIHIWYDYVHDSLLHGESASPVMSIEHPVRWRRSSCLVCGDHRSVL